MGTILPDAWPGMQDEIGRRVTEGETEFLVPGWIMPDWASWLNVTLVCPDPWAQTSVRNLLARSGAVRLRVVKNAAAVVAEPGDPDMVVWVRLRHDGQPEIARHVAILRRIRPHARQLVISDAIPPGMSVERCPLTGVWLANGRECVSELYSLLTRALTAKPMLDMFRPNALSATQWRVLLMRAAGADTQAIIEASGMSYKTVSVHESAIRERLGLVNRAEYAWLLRAVSHTIAVMPGITRLAKVNWRATA
ncbi:TPA: LuxR family transcriptional regulator [Klebsiella oxytoca]|nr:LuxR family transcriptional regulator [Klebsiella oxytoca]